MAETNAGERSAASVPGGQGGGVAGRSQQGPGEPTANQGLKLDVFQLSDVGRVRTSNEDFADYHIPQDPKQIQQKGMLFLVADGMGGHQAGEVASQQAVRFVVGQYFGDTTHDISTSLSRAFRAANRLVHEQAKADPDKAGMGTTLVGAAVLGHKVYIANVGDSRAYLVGQSGTVQITEDHSWVEEQVRAGLLSPEQARVHPQRNLVTRALGSKPSVEVDLFEGQIGKGDALVLCTDGLTNYVRDAEIEAIVRQNSARDAGQILVDLAKERGGRDNITVMIVSAGTAAPVAARRVSKPARGVPVTALLVGVTILLAVVAAGVIFLPGLLRQSERQLDVTTGVSPSASVVPTLPTAEAPATPAVASTATAGGAELPVERTPGEVTAAVTPEEGSAGTAAVEIPTGTPGSPTETLVPTYTPSSTATPTATATQTATPTQTRLPLQPPVLLDPREDDELQGEVEFEWSYSGVLPPGESFQVLIWKDGVPGPHEGAAGFWREPGPTRFKQKINLDEIDATMAGEDNYRWTVVVVNIESGQRKTAEGDGRRFHYLGRPATPTPKPSGCESVDCEADCEWPPPPAVCPYLCVFCCGGCHY